MTIDYDNNIERGTDTAAADIVWLTELEAVAHSARSVALQRIRYGNNGGNGGTEGSIGCGLAALLVHELSIAMDRVSLSSTGLCKKQPQQKHNEPSQCWDESPRLRGDYCNNEDNLRALKRILILHLQLSRIDPIWDEEAGRQGSHRLLCRLLCLHRQPIVKLDTSTNEPQQDEETDKEALLEELQDLAAEIAAVSSPYFPLPMSPLTPLELQQRLPLQFAIAPLHPLQLVPELDRPPLLPSSLSVDQASSRPNLSRKEEETMMTVLIQQVTRRQSAQEDVGFVVWPAAVILARWIVSHPLTTSFFSTYSNSSSTPHAPTTLRILEIGAGCGLAGIVAARHFSLQPPRNTHPSSVGAVTAVNVKVTLTDVNRTVQENLKRNVVLNDVQEMCTVEGLDFHHQHPPLHHLHLHLRLHEQQKQQHDSILPVPNEPQQLRSGKGQGWRDLHGRVHDRVDLILGADIICQPQDAHGAARLIAQALKPVEEGSQALIVCADASARFGVDHFVPACTRLGLSVQTHCFWNHCSNDNDYDALEQTTGYVSGMRMNLFRVTHYHS